MQICMCVCIYVIISHTLFNIKYLIAFLKSTLGKVQFFWRVPPLTELHMQSCGGNAMAKIIMNTCTNCFTPAQEEFSFYQRLKEKKLKSR